MITVVLKPSSSSALSAIQGSVAYDDANPATVTTITYNFATTEGSLCWTSAYKAQFEAALAVIESIANIDFVESFSSVTADLVEFVAPSSFFGSSNVLGFHYGPSNSPSYGAFNTDYWDSGAFGNGDLGGTSLPH